LKNEAHSGGTFGYLADPVAGPGAAVAGVDAAGAALPVDAAAGGAAAAAACGCTAGLIQQA